MRKLLIGSLLLLVGCFLLACLGAAWPADVLANLVAGWVFYGYQILPQVRLNVVGILTATVSLAAFAVGLHAFLRWLYQQIGAARPIEGVPNRSWPIRWTGSLLGLIMLMFVAGLAAVGISHQTVWLLTSPEPIIRGSREPSARAQSQNNLKQMALAMNNYAGTYDRILPSAAIWSKDGQPLLSWRVLILPYIEQQNLFQEFHLDEPWDSPHNLRLLPRMPKVYISPLRKDTSKPHTTHYQVFVGRGAAFEGKHGLRLPDDFPDGTANTFLVVEAAQAVLWSKPADLHYEPNRPLPALKIYSRYGSLAAMADGSVRQIEREIREESLRGLVTRNGGELDLAEE